jgi:acyl-CoA thioesterase FadM
VAGYLETYRGWVAPWECDIVDHLTVAFYFERFADSSLWLMEDLGLGQSYIERQGRTCATVDCYVRYSAELRAGDLHHIESAPIGVDDKLVTLGHKVINSTTGGVCATLEQRLLHFDMKARKAVPLPADKREAIAARIVAWDGPAREERPTPESADGFVESFRNTTRPWEVDVLGHVGFQFYIHRFSAACGHALGAMGMTPEYLREARIGFSTFEFQLQFRRELKAGDLVHCRSGIMHVGNSSVRFLHKMWNARTGELCAQLSQFGVHLDMDARRPRPFPEAIKAKGMALLVTT